MPTYAEQTTVSPEKSRAEIEATLVRYGARSFMYGWDEDAQAAVVGFVKDTRQIRFTIAMPSRTDRAFTHTPERRTPRAPAQVRAEYDKAIRQRWRALALVIKAKLEAVESGITTFEVEFAMHMVLPNGQTAATGVLAAIDQAYASGTVPPMLAIEGPPDE